MNNYQKQLKRHPRQLRKRYSATQHRFVSQENGGKLFSVSIMAHPARKKMVDRLRMRLGSVPVSYDEGGGLWHNCKSAWGMHGSKPYHLVLQDDAVLCEQFISRVDRVLSSFDDRRCVSLYAGDRKNYRSLFEKKMRRGYVLLPNLHWGVAVILPTDLIPRMMHFGDLSSIRTDDSKIGAFCKSIKMPVHYPLPSLVDHADGPSLVGDGSGRKAFAFAGSGDE